MKKNNRIQSTCPAGAFWTSVVLLALVILVSMLAGVIAPYGVNDMVGPVNAAPSAEHFCGTDSLGRDVWSRVLYGGRNSLFIGASAGAISAGLAIIFGTLSGLAGPGVNRILSDAWSVLYSIPQILEIVFLLACFGSTSGFAIAGVIGITGWMGTAPVVRNEVKKLRDSDYIAAAKQMGADLPYLLRVHILPNLVPALIYPVISNMGSAIIVESTLSFLGLGLPLDSVSWGTMLTEAEKGLLAGQWWLVVFPGAMLVLTLIATAEIAEHFRKVNTRMHNNL